MPTSRIEEIRKQLYPIFHSFEVGQIDDVLAKQMVNAVLSRALTQDRASIHTSLVAAVEGLELKKKVMHDHEYIVDKSPKEIKRDTLTIINSIFKE